MIVAKNSAVLLSCLVAVGVAGCGRVGRFDDSDRNNRIVAKAYEMANQGDYDAAIILFTKALEAYPRLSRPHLDLALLLHDRKSDYVRAIYHYNRYLELRPGTEKESMVRDRIRQAERAFGAIYLVDGAPPRNLTESLESENSVLKQKNSELAERVLELEQEISAIREAERQRYKATVVGDGAVVTPPPSAPRREAESSPVAGGASDRRPPPKLTPAAPAAVVVHPPRVTPVPAMEALPVATVSKRDENATPAEPSVVRTYTVRRGDSLSKIAYKVYGDATEWRKIQDANSESLGDSVNVKVGQVLVVP